MDDEKLFREGTQMMLGGQFVELKELLGRHSKDESLIRFGVLETFLALMGALSSFGERELADTLDLAWKHEARANRMASNAKGELSIRARLVQADTHLFGAMVQILQESYVKAFLNLRRSWKFYENARDDIEKLPANAAQSELHAELRSWSCFGVGLFNLLLSMLPPSIVAVASVIGFGADRITGIQLLRASITSSLNVAPRNSSPQPDAVAAAPRTFITSAITSQAPYALIIYLLYLVTSTAFLGIQTPQNLSESAELLDAIDLMFPNASIMMFHRSRLLRCQRKLQESLVANIRAGESLVVIMPSLAVIVDYNSAFACFFMQKWRASATYFARLLGRGSNAQPSAAASSVSQQQQQQQQAEEFTNEQLLAVASPPASGTPSRASSQMLYCYLIGVCMVVLHEWDVARAFFTAVPQWALKREKPRPVEQYAAEKSLRALKSLDSWRSDCQNLPEGVFTAPSALLDAVEVSLLWNGFVQVSVHPLCNIQLIMNCFLYRAVRSSRTRGASTRHRCSESDAFSL